MPFANFVLPKFVSSVVISECQQRAGNGPSYLGCWLVSEPGRWSEGNSCPVSIQFPASSSPFSQNILPASWPERLLCPWLPALERGLWDALTWISQWKGGLLCTEVFLGVSNPWYNRLLFIFKLLFWSSFRLKQNCKNCTRNSHIPFIQLFLILKLT